MYPKLHSSYGSVQETHISPRALREPLHHVGSLDAISSWKKEEKNPGLGQQLSDKALANVRTEIWIPRTHMNAAWPVYNSNTEGRDKGSTKQAG